PSRRCHPRLPLRRRDAAAADWGPRLRRRSARPGAGRAGHRDDRAAPTRAQEAQDAGWPSAAPLQAPLEDRAALRLVGQLPSPGRALRALCAQLPGLCPTGVHPHPAPAGIYEMTSSYALSAGSALSLSELAGVILGDLLP